MSQLYNTLIHSHEAVNYAENEMALFTTICQDVLTITDIKMAWIGLIDETIQQLNPLVHCGEGTEYLQDIHIDVSADNPSGNGPSGIACREDQPYWCQDFLHDENTTLWHAQAKKFGWQSSAALPFHKNGMVIGTLNLYSNELNAFDEQTRSLLQKITSNMDYTLAEFENEKSRKKNRRRFDRFS